VIPAAISDTIITMKWEGMWTRVGQLKEVDDSRALIEGWGTHVYTVNEPR
jgi:hypothetical protein